MRHKLLIVSRTAPATGRVARVSAAVICAALLIFALMVATSFGEREPAPLPEGGGGHGRGYGERPVTDGVYERSAARTEEQTRRGEAAARSDALKPRFVGWRGGVYIYTPDLEPAAEAISNPCRSTPTTVDPPLKYQFPKPERLPPGASEVGTQFALQCDGAIFVVSRRWAMSPWGGQLRAVRWVGRWAIAAKAPVDRIRSGTVRGRRAQFIHPLTDDGYGNSQITIRLEDGLLVFAGIDVPWPDLVSFAEEFL